MSETKANWAVRNFTELVGLFESKPRAFVMVLLFSVIIFLGYDLRRVYNLRAVDSEERLKRSEDIIYNNLIQRVEPEITQMRENSDSSRATVDSLGQRLIPLIDKISGEVDSKRRR